MRKLLLIISLVASFVSPSAHAVPDPKPFTYTLAGGNIGGTLNGVAFSNASWSITMTADATAVTSPSTSWSPLNMVAVNPLLTLTTGLQTQTMSLLNSDSFYWALVSRDYSGFFGGNPFGMTGLAWFEVGDSEFGGERAIYVDGTANFISLTEELELSSPSGFDTSALYAISTDLGDLFVTSNSGENGSFSAAEVVAVPEPSTYALLVGAAALGVGAWRRRRQSVR